MILANTHQTDDKSQHTQSKYRTISIPPPIFRRTPPRCTRFAICSHQQQPRTTLLAILSMHGILRHSGLCQTDHVITCCYAQFSQSNAFQPTTSTPSTETDVPDLRKNSVKSASLRCAPSSKTTSTSANMHRDVYESQTTPKHNLQLGAKTRKFATRTIPNLDVTIVPPSFK